VVPSETEKAAIQLPVTDKLLRGFFWSFIGTGARFLALAGSMVTARLLGKETYGEIGMIQSTIYLLGTFTGFGLGITTTKHVAALKEIEPERTGRIIALTNMVAIVSGTTMAVFCLLAAPWIADKALNAPKLADELRLGAFILLFSALLGVQAGTLSGLQNFKAIAKINIYQGIFLFPLSVVLILIWDLKGAVLSLVFQTIIGVILSSRIISKECANLGISVNFRHAWSEKQILWNFSLPAFLAASMAAPVNWAVRSILVHQDNGYAEMGLFNAAQQIGQVMSFVPLIVGQVTVPFFSEIYELNNQKYFIKAINYNLRSVWTIGLVFNFLIIGFAQVIMLLFGRNFQEGEAVLTVLTCSTVFLLIGNTLGQGLIGAGKIWINFSMNFSWALIILPAAYYLTPLYGAFGLALASLISYFGLSIAFLFYSVSNYSIQIFNGLTPLIVLTILAICLSLSVNYILPIYIYILSVLLSLISVYYFWLLMPLQFKIMIQDFHKKIFHKI
jgi:O-antigen/teichoic acid export membrane protein